jgi:predicted nucleic acid-binding protein
MMSQAMNDLTVFKILDFNNAASKIFDQINVRKVQLGGMDARIAAIALSQDLILLLTRR